jgi:hypothetical protein
MSLLGRWRIVEMPDYSDDYPDMGLLRNSRRVIPLGV